jgi:RNA polymerase sigma-70 factor (ECF subfamily)
VPSPGGEIDPERWLEEHGDALYRYALLRVRQSELAGELVQEAFVSALRARDTFSGLSSERTWLIGILNHKIIDQYRKASRRQSPVDPDSPDPVLDHFFDRRGRWKRKPAAWPGDPAEAIEKSEFWQTLTRCLAKIPTHFADVFFLRELDERAGEEICQILNITATNLWARLHRARLLLRQCLEKYGFSREGGR